MVSIMRVSDIEVRRALPLINRLTGNLLRIKEEVILKMQGAERYEHLSNVATGLGMLSWTGFLATAGVVTYKVTGSPMASILAVSASAGMFSMRNMIIRGADMIFSCEINGNKDLSAEYQKRIAIPIKTL